jgi:GxxExxY protein
VENEITERIIGAAIEVHRHVGPGLLESAYEECLCYEMDHRGLQFLRQVAFPIRYKGILFEASYRIDLLVEECVIVEVKSTEGLIPVHCAQLLTYLRLSDKRVGLLINFNVAMLKDGIKRVVNAFEIGSTPRLSPSLSVSASKEASSSASFPIQDPL